MTVILDMEKTIKVDKAISILEKEVTRSMKRITKNMKYFGPKATKLKGKAIKEVVWNTKHGKFKQVNDFVYFEPKLEWHLESVISLRMQVKYES